MSVGWATIVGTWALLGLPLSGQSPSTPQADAIGALRFRFAGPPMGNRASAVAGEPGNPLVADVGAASGGVWKTRMAGVNWRPVFDRTDVAAIGALAVAPSEHNVGWAGTGEPWIIRMDYPMGDGIYKSTDAGATWQHMGLEQTGHFSRIVVDPRSADRVFACAPGRAVQAGTSAGDFPHARRRQKLGTGALRR